MKIKKFDLSQTISILANLGIIASIVFLALQINQATRVARLEARVELTARNFDLQKAILDNPAAADLLVKLREAEPELTPREEVLAQSYADLLLNVAVNANVAVQSGFLSEETVRGNVSVLRNLIRRSPGIKPFLADVLAQRAIRRGFSPMFDVLFDEMERT